MNAPLNIQARIVAELMERISDPDAEQDGELIEAAEQAAQTLEEACASVLRAGRLRKGYAAACREIAREAMDRAARHEAYDERCRKAVAWAMEEASLPKITAPDMTVSWRMGKAPLIIDAEAGTVVNSARYVETKETYSWNKGLLKSDLDSGVSLPFARLGNSQPVLTVRTK